MSYDNISGTFRIPREFVCFCDDPVLIKQGIADKERTEKAAVKIWYNNTAIEFSNDADLSIIKKTLCALKNL